ncbi:MAG: sigma-70 family RNA polymerase sigma factor [Aerococcus sp.]|nr:sigma-70 family RNA polymerase sigma factor [Aerococcus sp.]
MSKKTDRLQVLCVNELVARYQQASGDEREALFVELLVRFRPLVRSYYRRFYNLQFEQDDFEQEMSICMWAALRTYKAERNVTFGAYLSIRLYRRCLDLFRFTRHPRRYTASGVTSLNTPIGEGMELADTVQSKTTYAPDHAFLVQEELHRFYGELSTFEYEVLMSVTHRQTFLEIATRLRKPSASVRSAYYRAHRKLREQLLTADGYH